MDKITVTVLNWEKHNPRKDIKNPTWFALSNRFLEDPEFFEFTPLERLATIYIFCQASQKNHATVTLNIAHAKRVCEIDSATLRRTIAKLSEIGAVHVEPEPRTDRVRARTDSERDIHTDIQDKTDTATFDFEPIYRTYPRHEGKGEGMTRLKARIKTQAEFDLFAKAVAGYKRKVEFEKTEDKYIKQWSSFVGAEGKDPWRDYIDWKPPTRGPKPITYKPAAEVLAEQERAHADEPELTPEERHAKAEQLRELMERTGLKLGPRQGAHA